MINKIEDISYNKCVFCGCKNRELWIDKWNYEIKVKFSCGTEGSIYLDPEIKYQLDKSIRDYESRYDHIIKYSDENHSIQIHDNDLMFKLKIQDMLNNNTKWKQSNLCLISYNLIIDCYR